MMIKRILKVGLLLAFASLCVGCNKSELLKNKNICGNKVGYLNWDSFRYNQSFFQSRFPYYLFNSDVVKEMKIYEDGKEKPSYIITYNNGREIIETNYTYDTSIETTEYDSNYLVVKEKYNKEDYYSEETTYTYDIDGNTITRNTYCNGKLINIDTQEKVSNGFVLHRKELREIAGVEEMKDLSDEYMYFNKDGTIAEYKGNDLYHFFYEGKKLKSIAQNVLWFINWKKYEERNFFDYDLFYENGLLIKEDVYAYSAVDQQRNLDNDYSIIYEDYDDYGNWTKMTRINTFGSSTYTRELTYIDENNK